MFPSKLAIKCIVLVCLTATAVAAPKNVSRSAARRPAQASPAPKPFSMTSLTLSYFSWNESVGLKSSSGTNTTQATLFGNSLILEQEVYPVARFGYVLQGGILVGVANIGGSQSAPTYNVSGQSWGGALAGVRASYRISRTIALSAGPLAIYRALSAPADPSGTQAQAGSPLNFGATGGLRLRMTQSWLVKTEFGTLLANDGTTFWSVGFGYTF